MPPLPAPALQYTSLRKTTTDFISLSHKAKHSRILAVGAVMGFIGLSLLSEKQGLNVECTTFGALAATLFLNGFEFSFACSGSAVQAESLLSA
eukprot:2064329-Amphidinium_carterae.1